MSANADFISVEEIDVDSDNNNEYVFEVDVSNARADPEPSREYNMVLVEEVAPTLNAPADQDSIGTGTQTGKISWQIAVTEMKGVRLARVWVTSNETIFMSLVDITSVSITGITTSIDADTRWDIPLSGVTNYRQPLDCILLEMEEDPDQDFISVTVKYESYFTVGTQAVNITLSIQTVGADEALDTAITDTVKLGG